MIKLMLLLQWSLPYLPALPAALAALLPYLPIIVPIVLGIIGLIAKGNLNARVREAVAAVYRVGIHAADALEDEGIAWLKSEAGVAYRRHLAEQAYDVLPAKIGSIPVGLVKVLVSREKWCELVEDAFQEVVVLADKLELPDELPTA